MVGAEGAIRRGSCRANNLPKATQSNTRENDSSSEVRLLVLSMSITFTVVLRAERESPVLWSSTLSQSHKSLDGRTRRLDEAVKGTSVSTDRTGTVPKCSGSDVCCLVSYSRMPLSV